MSLGPGETEKSLPDLATDFPVVAGRSRQTDKASSCAGMERLIHSSVSRSPDQRQEPPAGAIDVRFPPAAPFVVNPAVPPVEAVQRPRDGATAARKHFRHAVQRGLKGLLAPVTVRDGQEDMLLRPAEAVQVPDIERQAVNRGLCMGGWFSTA